MTQFVTRVDQELAQSVDELVADGTVASRSDAVRLGLRYLVDRHRRAKVGRQIADAYRLLPQTEEEAGWADAATEKVIAEEPW
jgi:Arc/MetJ-type ribon-helix-helix transcriptional regulator